MSRSSKLKQLFSSKDVTVLMEAHIGLSAKLATEAGFEACKPGATTSDVFRAMNDVLKANGSLGNDVGRMGHGLGMQVTEWPSHTATDETPIEANMVLTLEPGLVWAPGKAMVHEEHIVVGTDGSEWLSRRADPGRPNL